MSWICFLHHGLFLSDGLTTGWWAESTVCRILVWAPVCIIIIIDKDKILYTSVLSYQLDRDGMCAGRALVLGCPCPGSRFGWNCQHIFITSLWGLSLIWIGIGGEYLVSCLYKRIRLLDQLHLWFDMGAVLQRFWGLETLEIHLKTAKQRTYKKQKTYSKRSIKKQQQQKASADA